MEHVGINTVNVSLNSNKIYLWGVTTWKKRELEISFVKTVLHLV